MKIFLQLYILLLCTTAVKAQQYYFAYVQTDNKQPFYVKINDKVLSSSASGYVVVPKLLTGNYTVTFGFPKEQFPQQLINMNIGNADAGFLLKDFGSKGWGLFNLETMQVAMNNAVADSKASTVVTNDDVFSNTLAGAANTDLSTPKKTQPVVVVEAVPVVVNKEPEVAKVVSQNAILKINASNDVDGKSYTYVDRSGASSDTIKVFIPSSKVADAVEPVKETTHVKVEKVEPQIKESKPETSAANQETKETKPTKFLDIDMSKPAADPTAPSVITASIPSSSVVTSSKPAPLLKDKPVVNFNSDCKAMADDNDFLKTRKKMAASASDDEMITVAKKSFKNICYSVDQIKNLSPLFLNDAGKYNFFDAAYPHIFDSQNFGQLQTLLTDQYYISRFKAMIRN